MAWNRVFCIEGGGANEWMTNEMNEAAEKCFQATELDLKQLLISLMQEVRLAHIL